MDQERLTLEQEMESVYCMYASLARFLDPETGLGGKLLWAGEPTEANIRLVRAANVAGAASLAASADAAVLRRTMREGALDFVVTDLGEALRILKNEIRKKQPVAVGVSVGPRVVAREMIERGVQPELIAHDLRTTEEGEVLISRGAFIMKPRSLAPGSVFHVLTVPPADQQPLAEFEQEMLNSLPGDDYVNRRWVRIAPRYLPTAARRVRSVVRAG
jgi:hypothetical protein